jgi:hypothetical protein
VEYKAYGGNLMRIEIRDKNLSLIQILPIDKCELNFKKSILETGNFELTTTSDVFEQLKDWNFLIVYGYSKSIFTGLVETIKINNSAPNSATQYRISGIDIVGVLNDKVIYPNAQQSFIDNTTNQLNITNKSLETAIKDIVKYNSSENIPIQNRKTQITNTIKVLDSFNNGRTVNYNGEAYTPILDFLREHLKDNNYFWDINFSILDNKNIFDVYPKIDKTNKIILSTDYNNIISLELEQSDSDTITSVLIGEYDGETFAKIGAKENDNETLKNQIGRRIEQYNSVSHSDTQTFDQLADEQIANEISENGNINTAIVLEPANNTFLLFKDYFLGDIVKIKSEKFITTAEITGYEINVSKSGINTAISCGIKYDTFVKEIKKLKK